MAKRLEHDLTYDAPPERVSAMLHDPGFRREVCEAIGVLRHDVTVEGGHVRIEQVQSPAGIPSFATKFVGEEIRIIQDEHWATPDRAGITVTIPGKPGDMSGTTTLSATADGGTVESVDMTVKVAIPLVGGKIEGLIADLLLKALKAENRVGRDYLSR
jgi:hypothetical protein